MAETKVRPKLSSAEVDAKYIVMGESAMGVVSDDAEAKALAAQNDGKFGRPFGYSREKIAHLATLHALTGAGLRRVQGMANRMYGKENTPDHSTLCRRINAAGEDLLPGVAVLCDNGRILMISINSTGMSMPKTNGWRQEKHGGKRGYLLEHAVAEEGTGRFIASKITTPEEGDAPQFADLIKASLRKSGIDPGERREEVRRRREDLAAEKPIILSRNDGIADTSPEAATKVAESVERPLAHGGERESGKGCGKGCGKGGGKGGGDAPKAPP